MVAFPSTEGLATSQDGSAFIYGGSVAINNILEHLRKTATLSHRGEWKVWLINMLTIVDGCSHKDASPKDIIAAAAHDFQLLTQFISAYASYSKDTAYRYPIIIGYWPSYTAIPEAHRRKPSPSLALAMDVFSRMDMGPTDVVVNKDDDRLLMHVRVGTRADLPHVDLNAKLARVLTGTGFVSGMPIAMITSFPTDLHLASRMSKMVLLERFTARIKGPSEFGTKLDKAGRLPFNAFTHLTFGDGVLIQGLISGRKKTALLELAEADRWSTLSATSVRDRIIANSTVIGSDFGGIRL